MDEKAVESYEKAGKIAKETLAWGVKLVKPGVSYLEVADKIEARITEAGAGLPFPTNISVNDIAAHYVPKANDKSVFTKEDVVKVDIGVHIDGYIADTAYTVDLTGEYGDMLAANQTALDTALDMVAPGVSVASIGEAVQDAITGAGYKPIENLTGHEIKQNELHAGLSIPNIKVPYDWQIEEGMAMAIEPFATDGAGHVIESPSPEIFSVQQPRPVRMREARMLLKTLAERGELPFAARWYAKKFSPLKLSLILNQLKQAEILHAYPPLHDRSKGKVSQFEHTVIVTEDGSTVTTR